jgi:amidase
MNTATQPDTSWDYRTTKELVAALQARKISAVELTDHVIARIEALDPKINAEVVRDFDRGRETAKATDVALSRGERLPLLGIPMVIKESFDVAGLPTTWGIPAFKDYIPSEDALMVARAKLAGAVILGKTNVPLMLGDWQSYNDIYGNDQQSLGSQPQSRRLIRWVVRGARRRLRAAIARLRRWRFVAHAGALLRHLRP